MSGVAVHCEVVECFQKMKMHTTKNAVDRQKAVLFEIQGNEIKINHKNCIHVDDIGASVEDAHKCLTDIVRQQSCCYILYDVEYETSVTKKQGLVLILWSDDDAPIKTKMMYAASADTLRRNLTGYKAYVELHDLDSFIDCEEIAEKLGSDVIRVEGRDVKCRCAKKGSSFQEQRFN